MIRVYGCIIDQHDFRLVILAGFLCLFASYTALSLFARVLSTSRRTRYLWLIGTAFVSGTGIWATHFVAMLAFRPGLPLGYNLPLTAASVTLAILISGLAFASVLSRRTATIGGGLFGVAVGAMHYTGMAALQVPAVQHWDVSYITASIAIGIVVGAIALAMIERIDEIPRRLTVALLLTLAICGHHFTAMAALTLEPDPTLAVPTAVMAPEWIAVAVASVTMLILGLSFAGTIIDQVLANRSLQETERLRRHVVELETTKRDLETKTIEVTLALEAAAAASQAKSQFLAAMSHELRTPLNAIIGFSEMLNREMFGSLGDVRYRDYARNIFDSGNHLLGLINDVLDFSKLEAGRFELQDEAVDVARIVTDTAAIIGQQAERGSLHLSLDLAQPLPRVRADGRRLRQILLNLISNAIKFTPEGGDVKVSAAIVDGDLVFVVADTGIGMSADDIPKALTRFGQIDSSFSRKYDGTGLGLPLSKRLAELHGGSLQIESALGNGTTVTVRLPRERVLGELRVA
jgi:signal transduction histidine kinase